ncbi:hypothetical protein PLESTB_001820600 [Pleodorina starrii]|uniref:Uncharacterized protein n=1 Tax=Pleodorina starrii TaxID=330485 RepID=A0A9W6C0W9_9CHLO|nr:hypothetical protein PLESTB_001820600 [Pleodorina starrii]
MDNMTSLRDAIEETAVPIVVNNDHLPHHYCPLCVHCRTSGAGPSSGTAGAAARPPVRRNNGSAQANRQRGQNMNARARQQHQQRPNNKYRRDAGRAIDPYAFRMDSVGPPGERLTLAQYQHYRKHYLCFGWSDEHLFSQCPKNPNRED